MAEHPERSGRRAPPAPRGEPRHRAQRVPGAAGRGGSLLAGFVVSYLVMVVGWVLFAGASLRARLAPRGASNVLIAGAVLAIAPTPTALRLLPLAVGAALVGRAMLRM